MPPDRSRQPAALQPGREVEKGRPQGMDESPASALARNPVNALPEQRPRGPGATAAESQRRTGPGGEQGAPGSCPKHTKTLTLLCSSSLNWKDHIFPAVYTLGSSGAPFKGHGWGVVFNFLCFPKARLREGWRPGRARALAGRLFPGGAVPASKTVRNSLPKFSQPPLRSPVTWELPLRGASAWVAARLPQLAPAAPSLPAPSSGPGPPWLMWPHANEGPGAPAHLGDAVLFSHSWRKAGGRTNRAKWEEEWTGRNQEGGGSVMWHAQTPPGYTRRTKHPPWCPMFQWRKQTSNTRNRSGNAGTLAHTHSGLENRAGQRVWECHFT